MRQFSWFFVLLLTCAGCSACDDTSGNEECTDLDHDGYGVGAGCLGTDCNDANSSCHSGACCPTDCTDGDGDGYGAGAGCLGTDCNDANASCHSGACCSTDCTDGDGDGYGVGAGCLGMDCNDANSSCHTGACCPTDCTDGDGDGYGVGTGCLGTDCDDANPSCHTGDCCIAGCTDGDGDGYGVGTDCLGTDCNDANPLCNTGACCNALYPQQLEDVTGMNPKLIASRDNQRIYLLTASPYGKVRRFNTSTLLWESGIPDIPGMSGIDLTRAPWTCAAGQCWGGPSLAVGESDVLHVVWGELGLNDCDPDNHFNTAVRLLYTQYSGSIWTSPEPIVERVMNEDNRECGYQYPNLAEDGAGNILLSYMHGVYVEPGNWNEGTHYYTYNDASEEWGDHGQIARFAVFSRNAGGFGRLVLGYGTPGHDHVAEIDPATGDVSADDVIAAHSFSPYLLLAGENDLHAFGGGGECDPECHINEIYYNRNAGSGWEVPGSLLISDDPAIFVQPPDGTEYTAIMGLAVMPSGRRLLTFSYAKKLYLVSYDGTAWGAPIETATDNEVWSQAVSAVGDQYYLVVWSAGLDPDAEIWWSLIPANP